MELQPLRPCPLQKAHSTCQATILRRLPCLPRYGTQTLRKSEQLFYLPPQGTLKSPIACLYLLRRRLIKRRGRAQLSGAPLLIHLSRAAISSSVSGVLPAGGISLSSRTSFRTFPLSTLSFRS